MDKKRLIILLMQVVLFTVFLIWLTAARSNTLKERLIDGSICLVLGLILLKFKQPIAEGMYKRQVKAIKQKSSVEEFTEGINQGGLLLSYVGIILILVGSIFR